MRLPACLPALNASWDVFVASRFPVDQPDSFLVAFTLTRGWVFAELKGFVTMRFAGEEHAITFLSGRFGHPCESLCILYRHAPYLRHTGPQASRVSLSSSPSIFTSYQAANHVQNAVLPV
jgi:hypothetical protein